MELLVFGHAGARVLVFPARCGHFYDYENWGMVAALREKIDAGLIQLFCMDSIDTHGLYANWMCPADRILRHLEYEAYVLNEVIPFTATKNPDVTLIAHGCSLGAYHAVNIACKYPKQFGKVVALSGRYDLSQNIGHYRDLFDGHFDDNIYANMPNRYVSGITDKKTLKHLRRIEFILTIGQEDVLLADSCYLRDTLQAKGVSTQLYFWDGEAHRPRFWRRMIPHYL